MTLPQLHGKKGVCFALRAQGHAKGGTYEENLPKVLALHPQWFYTWNAELYFPREDHALPREVDFVPMTWGYYPKSFAKTLATIAKQSPKFLFAFNEPDGKDQSNVPVEKAIAAWPEMQQLNIPLISPSCVHAEKEWMQDFMKQVKQKDLRVDVVGVHDYGGGNAAAFKKKLQRIHNLYQRPIIISEFAIADWKAKEPGKNCHSPKKALSFMQEMLPWLEQQDWILGYSWFSFSVNSAPGCCSALYDDEKGKLTELGEFYANFEAESTTCPAT